MVTELHTRTETQAVRVDVLLSFNGTFYAEFLSFNSYNILNISSAAFTFSHVVSPLSSDLNSLIMHRYSQGII